jgi:hypothetical protein
VGGVSGAANHAVAILHGDIVLGDTEHGQRGVDLALQVAALIPASYDLPVTGSR